MRASAACLVIHLVLFGTAYAQAPVITNFSIAGVNADLEWDIPTNRFIVEQSFSLTTGTWSCVGSSTGFTKNAILVPLPDVAVAFFRMHFGLQVVRFPDHKIESAVRRAIQEKHQPTNEVYDVDLVGLTNLQAGWLYATNIGGLEHCHDLEVLDLAQNDLLDITPLSGLTNLTYLNLWSSPIGQCNALAGLTRLETLHLDHCDITDLSPLAALTNLTALGLNQNYVQDISPLIANAQAGGLGPGDTVWLIDGSPLTDPNQVTTLRETYGVTVLWP